MLSEDPLAWNNKPRQVAFIYCSTLDSLYNVFCNTFVSCVVLYCNVVLYIVVSIVCYNLFIQSFHGGKLCKAQLSVYSMLLS